MDKLSIIHALGSKAIATKTWKKDGSVDDYNAGRWFRHGYANVGSVADMHALLLKLEGKPKALVIRGALIAGKSNTRVRRTYADTDPYFEDQPLHLFCIDIDGFVPLAYDPVLEPGLAIDEYLDRMFTDGSFNGVSYAWQLSSSAGHAKNVGVLKAHVWFWSSVAYTSEQMKAWSRKHSEYVDISLYTPVQPHYVALPQFEEGVVDPVPQRCGLVRGKPNVVLSIAPAEIAVATRTRKAKSIHEAHKTEPTAKFLFEHDMVKGLQRGGEILNIVCPFEEEHSSVDDSPGDSSTRYALANTGLHERGHFTCLHGSCQRAKEANPASRSDDAFRFKMGMADAVLDDFDVVEDEEAPRKENWAEKIEGAASAKALQLIITGGIAADKALDAVDLSALEAAARAKFAELGAPLRADPLRKLFKPVCKRALPDFGSSEMPLETLANLEAVCNNYGVVVRYNVIKKDDEILIANESWSLDNSKSASITWLRSACHKEELKTTHLKNFVTLIADKNQFNPVAEWITSKEWDGVSRLEAFYSTVQEDAEKCSAKIKRVMMMRWAISAIAAAFNPNGVMARGVLVFQGQQYAGKTRWIDALAPKDKELVKTGRSLNVHDKDSVKQIVSSWISELGELDSTFKKSDIAALKAFITSDMDELRRPYAAAESQYARRTVFAASVNEAHFLQDDTGNSRFWVIPILSIDHAHTLDMQQVWAEFYELWLGGEKHYMTEHEMSMLNGHNESFTAPDPIYELISGSLVWEGFDVGNCQWMQASDVLRWLGRENPSKMETILAGKAIQVLNRGHTKKVHGQRLAAVPLVKKCELEFDL